MAPFDYAGESFLTEQLPDYSHERITLVTKLVLASLFWILLVPILLSQEVEAPESLEKRGEEKKAEKVSVSILSTPSKKKTNSKKKTKKEVVKIAADETVVDESETLQKEPIREVDAAASVYAAFGCMFSVLYIMLRCSPENYYTARGVFEAPLFTRDECSHIIDMAEQVAIRNYGIAQNVTFLSNIEGTESNETIQGFLKEPVGWQKKRHGQYPTTDLNIVTDPFTKTDRAWIKEKLDARLAPTLQRLFGVPTAAIRAIDIFVVRYDGDRRASLNRHTDSGDITFSTLLSDGFEGGGTRYWNRWLEKPFLYLLPTVGKMTMFPAMIAHEGVEVDEGRRYLLIGFLSVDQKDPWTAEPTGLSWFSSWGSLNWASVKFKEGYNSAYTNLGMGVEKWTNQQFARGFFLKMLSILSDVADALCPHFFTSIVDESRADEFLRVLDEAHAKTKDMSSESASWFKGQMVNLDIDGTVNSLWVSRESHEANFEDHKI